MSQPYINLQLHLYYFHCPREWSTNNKLVPIAIKRSPTIKIISPLYASLCKNLIRSNMFKSQITNQCHHMIVILPVTKFKCKDRPNWFTHSLDARSVLCAVTLETRSIPKKKKKKIFSQPARCCLYINDHENLVP